MKNNAILLFSLCVLILSGCTSSSDPAAKFFNPGKENSLRAPAYPLVTIDPYTSGWSFVDKLNEDIVRHWTGKPFP